MARPRKLPDMNTLIRWRDEGLTQQQMADRVWMTTGEKVSRGSISAALVRAGKSSDKPRYKDTVPWKVQQQHLTEYPVRMLRLLGRRRAGLPLKPEEDQRLDNWLAVLKREKAVVGYDPDNPEQGFHYIDPKGSDGRDGIPIRRQRIWTT